MSIPIIVPMNLILFHRQRDVLVCCVAVIRELYGWHSVHRLLHDNAGRGQRRVLVSDWLRAASPAPRSTRRHWLRPALRPHHISTRLDTRSTSPAGVLCSVGPLGFLRRNLADSVQRSVAVIAPGT